MPTPPVAREIGAPGRISPRWGHLAGAVVALGLSWPTLADVPPSADGSSVSPAANFIEAISGAIRKGLGPGHQQPEFLQADAAFALTIRIDDARSVTARWDIADGYYLYRDKMAAAILDQPTIGLASVHWPKGKAKVDEAFGLSEVYYTAVEATLHLQRPDSREQTPLTLELRYQGCADAGFCYPPVTKRIPIVLPGVADMP